jgi:hypothetical protein
LRFSVRDEMAALPGAMKYISPKYGFSVCSKVLANKTVRSSDSKSVHHIQSLYSKLLHFKVGVGVGVTQAEHKFVRVLLDAG